MVKSLTKVDLHRHIEGAVAPRALKRLCNKNFRGKPKDLNYFKRLLTIERRAGSLDEFIAKLGTKYLKKYVRAPQDLVFVFEEALRDAARDNVTYTEFRFTLSNFMGLDETSVDLIKKISLAMRIKSKELGIKFGLILGFKRDDDETLNMQIVKVAKGLCKSKDIVGVDLAGNEHFYPNELFKNLAKEIKKACIPFTVHAGEVTGAGSVRTAVELLGADRIGHGTRAAFDEKVMSLLVKKKVLLEVCPTSNLDTSAYKTYEEIPIRKLLDNKVPILICTDDPVTSGITLSWEVENLIKRKIITLTEYKQMLAHAKKFYFD